MEEILWSLLSWLLPLMVWFPLSPPRREVRWRPEPYLLAGALAAIPTALIRTAVAPEGGLFTHLALDGLVACLFPLGALLLLIRKDSRPETIRDGSSRASLVLLGYALVDGALLMGLGQGSPAMAAALVLPRMALAPFWGLALHREADTGLRVRLFVSSSIPAAALAGSVLPLMSVDLQAPSLIFGGLFYVGAAIVLLLSAREDQTRQSVAPNLSECPNIPKDNPGPERIEVAKAPRHRVFPLMREERYAEARDEAERYLDRYADSRLYCWHALLRWLNGERAYRHLFLRRYLNLDEADKARLKAGLEEYLGSRSAEVAGWIRVPEHKLEQKHAQEGVTAPQPA